jgi:hypothetical protein
MSWWNKAACAGKRRLLPENHMERIGVMKALCATCPVRQRCLEEAIAIGAEEEVWGGMTPSERNAYRATVAA